MSDKQQFDLLIIGSGEAGKNLAWTMAKAGCPICSQSEQVGSRGLRVENRVDPHLQVGDTTPHESDFWN